MKNETSACSPGDSYGKIRELKRKMIQVSARAKEGHLPSAFSILDLLWVLYDKILCIDPREPRDPNRDYFVLSKGHASIGLYSILEAKNFLFPNELETFCEFESRLGGHPDSTKVPGVEASTGSLGHGLPMAVGMALGLKIQKKSSRVFALIGDGEANEGTVWESALLAAHHCLDNFCLIVDYNHSTDRALQLNDLKAKFSAFGWETEEIAGHDHDAIEKALGKVTPGRPRCLIAQTVKGKGCRPMENNPAWHHRFPKSEEVDQLIGELT
jgi:transketolase